MQSVCVFAGSSSGARTEYAIGATRLGAAIAARGWTLVYGGGNVGLMRAVADAALAAGGRVVGVIPRGLMVKELAHEHLSELHVVASMHERKALMAALAGGMVALPGGFGTLEEWFEVLTWSQLGLHLKPCGLLNVAGYYDPLLQLLDHMVSEQFVKGAHRDMIIASSSCEELLDAMRNFQPPAVPKWIDRAST